MPNDLRRGLDTYEWIKRIQDQAEYLLGRAMHLPLFGPIPEPLHKDLLDELETLEVQITWAKQSLGTGVESTTA